MNLVKSFKKRMKVSLCLFLILLSSCVSHYSFPPLEELPPLPDCSVPSQVRLALVLGGGGAKGVAHLGVLEEFEKAKIPIDLIVGCSAGSLVGALYCDHPDALFLKNVLTPMKMNHFIDINLFNSRYGLTQGAALYRTMRKHLTAQSFDELKIPLVTVATDLYSGELISIGGGPLIPAVQASCAIPLVFAPIKLYGRVLVDGGVVDPVPVQVAKWFNPEIIVAVDLGRILEQSFPDNLFDIAKRSAEITLIWQTEHCIKGADFIIRPNLFGFGVFEEGYQSEMYEAGCLAAREVIPQIKKALQMD